MVVQEITLESVTDLMQGISVGYHLMNSMPNPGPFVSGNSLFGYITLDNSVALKYKVILSTSSKKKHKFLLAPSDNFRGTWVEFETLGELQGELAKKLGE